MFRLINVRISVHFSVLLSAFAFISHSSPAVLVVDGLWWAKIFRGSLVGGVARVSGGDDVSVAGGFFGWGGRAERVLGDFGWGGRVASALGLAGTLWHAALLPVKSHVLKLSVPVPNVRIHDHISIPQP